MTDLDTDLRKLAQLRLPAGLALIDTAVLCSLGKARHDSVLTAKSISAVAVAALGLGVVSALAIPPATEAHVLPSLLTPSALTPSTLLGASR
jgi:hypothetical protein